jgi:hypothetical protein
MGKDFEILFDTSKLPRKSVIDHIFKAAMVETQNTVLQKVYDESQTMVPVSTGALKDSAVFEKANEFELEAYIQYGDDMVNYALVVHEDLSAVHNAPEQAKYLEVPMTRHQPELLPTLIRNLEKHWNEAGLSSSFSAGTFSEQIDTAFGE